MGFFGFVFWMVVIWMVIRFWHRREGRRMAGPRGYAPNSGWYDSGEFYNKRGRELRKAQRDPTDDQQQYIESLESRVSQLEERLDFTERLLSERREPVGG
ncbi:MAG TPA: hypothetical protein VNO19_03575 [Gemmatimonadales bacterium]|nr:hypothetical protein [Gemmatimonadales bacterium]